MTTSITIHIEALELRATLNNSETAAALAARLPFSLTMTRWGDEYYGDIGEPLGVGEEPGARDEMEIGEIAWWPPGNALCFFFGPTPASVADEPRAASAVNPVGRIEGDSAALKELLHSIEVILEQAAD